MKISRWESVILLLASLFAAFSLGWFLRGAGAPVRVDRQKNTPEEVMLRSTTEEKRSTGLIDLNTATAEDLTALPGIGAKKAADIIAEREANGPFRSPEELTRVKGIGEGTVAALEEYVTVGGDGQ